MILLCCGENLITYLVTFLTCSVLLIFLTIQFKCQVTKNGLIKIIIIIIIIIIFLLWWLHTNDLSFSLSLSGQIKPVTTEVLPAPKAIIEMVRCQCRADCSTDRCSCRSNNLSCTDLCQCGTQCQNDEDSRNDVLLTSDSDDDE